MPYQPFKKIDTEEKLNGLDQTALQHSYTWWVKIQEQNFAKKKFDGDELKEIETVSTVSPDYYLTNLCCDIR